MLRSATYMYASIVLNMQSHEVNMILFFSLQSNAIYISLATNLGLTAWTGIGRWRSHLCSTIIWSLFLILITSSIGVSDILLIQTCRSFNWVWFIYLPPSHESKCFTLLWKLQSPFQNSLAPLNSLTLYMAQIGWSIVTLIFHTLLLAWNTTAWHGKKRVMSTSGEW